MAHITNAKNLGEKALLLLLDLFCGEARPGNIKFVGFIIFPGVLSIWIIPPIFKFLPPVDPGGVDKLIQEG